MPILSGGKAMAEGATCLEKLLADVRACRACEDSLPLCPKPILQIGPGARLLIASQAPGAGAHRIGRPFSDPSGDRLREWTGMAEEQFYDENIVAILPMGLCYPGRAGGGDAPPRPECARLWRERLLEQMPALRLTLLVGSHAQAHILGPGSMTERVRAFRACLPAYFPLPHPSWRTVLFERKKESVVRGRGASRAPRGGRGGHPPIRGRG